MGRHRGGIYRLAAGLLLVWPILVLAITDAQPAASQPQRTPKDHVYYLAQPVVKGRAPNTVGSQRARQYIMDRFQEDGLVPWAKESGYELPFDGGTNVVGVLPGSDPQLADKFVLVTAHYDHLGIQEGKVYPGATDNASGVAAVLEIARRLSQQSPGPKRSIAFCAFDAEERGLLGAKAFGHRADFPRRKVAADVNIDMLGHEPTDDAGRVLLQMGSRGLPRIRKPLQQAAAREGITLVPMVATGMGSDHAVFNDLNIPYLFFCCGICEDLHQPTDTADKLDYTHIEHDLNVIVAGVHTLADAPEKPKPASQPAASDPAPLATGSRPGPADAAEQVPRLPF